jgi:catalase
MHSEATHMFMWAMSDRGIPRSYRMMQGFGVNTFTLTNAKGERSFVKFHFTPTLGVHSLLWDEALKICGQDPDFHRKDLYSAIENGVLPTWKFGKQLLRTKCATLVRCGLRSDSCLRSMQYSSHHCRNMFQAPDYFHLFQNKLN